VQVRRPVGFREVVLPKRNVTNARAAIGKMQGAVEVAETDGAVFIKSGDRGRIVLEKSDDNHSLSLLAISRAARCEVTLKGQLRECNVAPGTNLTLNIILNHRLNAEVVHLPP
jgi:hypothetical protein